MKRGAFGSFCSFGNPAPSFQEKKFYRRLLDSLAFWTTDIIATSISLYFETQVLLFHLRGCDRIQGKGAIYMQALKILAKNSMSFYLLMTSLVFAYIIYATYEVKYCIKLPAIAMWFYMAINVALNYEEECRSGEKVDRKPIAYVLLFCGLTGAFAGMYVDISSVL